MTKCWFIHLQKLTLKHQMWVEAKLHQTQRALTSNVQYMNTYYKHANTSSVSYSYHPPLSVVHNFYALIFVNQVLIYVCEGFFVILFYYFILPQRKIFLLHLKIQNWDKVIHFGKSLTRFGELWYNGNDEIVSLNGIYLDVWFFSRPFLAIWQFIP